MNLKTILLLPFVLYHCGSSPEKPIVNVYNTKLADTQVIDPQKSDTYIPKEDISYLTPDSSIVDDIPAYDVSQSYDVPEVIPADVNITDIKATDVPDLPDLPLLEDLLTDSDAVDITEDINPTCGYTNNFNSIDDLTNLVVQAGSWKWTDGYALQDKVKMATNAYFNVGQFTDFEASVRVKMLDLDVTTGVDSYSDLVFRYNPESQTGYTLKFGNIDGHGSSNLPADIDFYVVIGDFEKEDLASAKLEGFNPYGEWQELKIKVVGPLLEAYFNGVKVTEITDQKYAAGYIGLATNNAQTQFDDVNVVCNTK